MRDRAAPAVMTHHLLKIRQELDASRLSDPLAALRDQLRQLDGAITPASSIAIAVGSRGIDHLSDIVASLCRYITSRGAHPFIVPAMGSHGGATAEGQTDVLRSYGVSESTVGAPVRATMEVVELPQRNLPIRIFMDRNAYEADGVILVNRIKPHTDFHGQYESGLMKMALIGLGKLEGARAVHDYGLYGLRELLAPGAAGVIASGKILAGIALVENAFHETMCLKVLAAGEIAAEEPKLLELARRNMPRLPVADVDVLVVDRMGKDISGVGIDPNITGRIGVDGQRDAGPPHVKAMIACDLTDGSHGNAIGIGLADVITQRLYDKIDRTITYGNVITSSFLERGKIPIVASSDREAFEVALRSCGYVQPGHERIVRILDTLHLEEMYVSKAIADELSGLPHVEVVGSGELFTADGGLTRF